MELKVYVLYWHKWTISAPGIIINNPESILMRTSKKLVTEQIYNFGIVNCNPWCAYSLLVPKQYTFMLELEQVSFYYIAKYWLLAAD